jgi:hypothetical protein
MLAEAASRYRDKGLLYCSATIGISAGTPAGALSTAECFMPESATRASVLK